MMDDDDCTLFEAIKILGIEYISYYLIAMFCVAVALVKPRRGEEMEVKEYLEN